MKKVNVKKEEGKIPEINFPEDNFRPRINSIDAVKKLAEDLRSSPTAVVNFLVDTGVEILTRSKEEIKAEFINKLRKLLK